MASNHEALSDAAYVKLAKKIAEKLRRKTKKEAGDVGEV
jgi:hypothetical protein